MADSFRVLLSDTLAPQGIEVLKRYPQLKFDLKPGLAPAELAAIIGDYDALLIRSGTKVTQGNNRSCHPAASDRTRGRGRGQR